MARDQNFLKRHPFDIHASQIENPIEDYARHIRAFEGVERNDEIVPEEPVDGVSLEKIFDEMTYDDNEIEGDLEYLTTSGFLKRDLEDDGRRSYSLTDEAETYLEDFLGRTSDYTESVDETLRREV